MNDKKGNNLKKYIALAILACFILSFLHSELGFINFDKGDHGNHDYCEIVKNIHAKTDHSAQKLTKPEIKKDFFSDIPKEISTSVLIFSRDNSAHLKPLKHTGEAFLFNRSFLI